MTNTWVFAEIILTTPPAPAAAIVWQWSTDGGVTTNDFLYRIEPSIDDDTIPSSTSSPIMLPYDPVPGLSRILLGFYDGSGNYVTGIKDVSQLRCMFIKPGQVPTPLPFPSGGPSLGSSGPFNYHVTKHAGPNTITAYRVDAPYY